jgi:hypothetical protein
LGFVFFVRTSRGSCRPSARAVLADAPRGRGRPWPPPARGTSAHSALAAIRFAVSVSLILCAAFAAPAMAQWRVVPEVRLTGGDETDLVVDPGVTRTVVPGGTFMELAPTLTARRGLGRGGLLNVGTFATLQRFLNDDGRQLYAQTIWGDLYQSLSDGLRARFSVAADYFDDSERETVRRFNEGAEAGLAWAHSRWSTEIWGGASARQYPNLTTVLSPSRSQRYTETAWSGGTTLRASPFERLAIRGGGIFQTTSARDPYYDSRSWTLTAGADARLVSTAVLTLSGSYQEREFTDRPAGLDSDTYWQVGAGLRYVVAGAWTASVRYGYSVYTWPDGSEEDSQRLAVGVHYAWGRRDAPPPPRVDVALLSRESGGSVQRPSPSGTVRLRVHAQDAGAVAVAGDFNGWDPLSGAMRRAADGWWEIDIELATGSYEYVYIIDGVWTTPPEAQLTADDGYGGRNGVLEILPPDV